MALGGSATRHVCVVLSICAAPASSYAAQPSDAVPQTREPTTEPDTAAAPPEWQLKYDEARAKLVAGEFAEAAARFADLESSTTNGADRAVAHAQRTLAEEWLSRGAKLVVRANREGGGLEQTGALPPPDRRSTDELVSLYTNAALYGIGSGVWLATLTNPQTVAAGVLPALVLTAGSVGTVVALDSTPSFLYGVPQSIVSGLYVGLEEGVVWTGWANSNHANLQTRTQATLIWSLSSIGAVGGGILGQALGTTPGRASWVGSAALWTGTIAGLVAGAAIRDGSTDALAVAGTGLTIGVGIGLATASSASPSIARVRLLDLSGLLGGLTTGALYAAAANDHSDGRAAAGVVALGTASGLVAGWFLTQSIQDDHPRRNLGLDRIRPMVLPAKSGAMIGASASLD
jgi:hypothetical protein